MQTFNSLIKKIQHNIILPRLVWIGCQALFGFLPIFILNSNFHYSFYSSVLLISYIGMSMLGINGFANLRWAKSKLDPNRAKLYFYLVFFCWLVVALLYAVFIKIDSFTVLLIGAGLLQNIKVLGISYLRNSGGKSLSSFFLKDSAVFILGSFGLFFVSTESSLIILLSVVFSGGLVFLLPTLNKIFISERKIFRKITLKYSYIILKNSIFLFFSTLFITYIPIIARTAVNMTQSEAFFVSFSVALSIAINLQKLSLQYLWAAQKKYWSKKSTGINNDKSSFTVLILIMSTGIFIFVAQSIFDMISSEVAFPIEVMCLTLIITFHRMAISYYRLHLLTVMSVSEILKNQIRLMAFLTVLFLGFYFLLNWDFLIGYVVIFTVTDLFFVNHVALSRRTTAELSIR